jgi:ABC-2 type transport system ATP-binding protein
MIVIDSVVKRFGNLAAVDGLSLEVPAGEFFVFLGPNGAGKTTTIKMIAGLLRPTEGRVLLCGHDVQRDGIRARSLLSYVPDQPFLYEKLTGREFLHFIGDMYGMERPSVEARIGEMSERFGLDGFLDELGQTYSHGMKQRVVVAGALLHDPKVLVIDEPMVGLDPKGANTLKAVLKELTRNGVTVFMSTHTLAVAEETADRVGIIRSGSLIALGTLREIYEIARTDHRLEDAFLRLTEEEA